MMRTFLLISLLVSLAIFTSSCSTGEKAVPSDSGSDETELSKEISPKEEKADKIVSDVAEEAEDKEGDISKLEQAMISNSEVKVTAEAAKLLSKDPKDSKVLNAMGVFYLRNKKYGLAKIFFNRALEGNPDNGAALNNLGVAAWEDDNDEFVAVAYFKKAIEKEADNVAAHANLGSYYLKYSDYQRANTSLKIAYRYSKKNKALANNYAVSLRGVQKYGDAEDVYEDIEGGNRDVSVMLNQAILWTEFKKEPDKARKTINKLRFLSTDPAILKKVETLDSRVDRK